MEGVIGFIFGAGVSWAILRQLRKDVNGLGAKLRADQKLRRRHVRWHIDRMLGENALKFKGLLDQMEE